MACLVHLALNPNLLLAGKHYMLCPFHSHTPSPTHPSRFPTVLWACSFSLWWRHLILQPRGFCIYSLLCLECYSFSLHMTPSTLTFRFLHGVSPGHNPKENTQLPFILYPFKCSVLCLPLADLFIIYLLMYVSVVWLYPLKCQLQESRDMALPGPGMVSVLRQEFHGYLWTK